MYFMRSTFGKYSFSYIVYAHTISKYIVLNKVLFTVPFPSYT